MSYLFAFSYCSWRSQGKNAEVVCHSLLQWTTCCQKTERWRIDALVLWCWRKLLRVPWTARRSNQSVKGNTTWILIGKTDAEAQPPILWLPDMKSWLTGQDPDAGKDWRQEEKEMTEDEMVGRYHWLTGHEFEQALGVGDGQGSLLYCSPWGHRVRHNWATELNWWHLIYIGLAKKFVRVFSHIIVQKDLDELFGQPNSYKAL